MSLADMRAELVGAVPKLPREFTKTLINRSWRTVRERNLWSFLLFEGQWISPQLFSTGTAACVLGSTTVILDADATAALNLALAAQPFSLATSRQFRVGASTIYNIWGYDDGTGDNAPFATLTLDRMYGDASAASSTFQIFQSYYVPADVTGPISDFKTFITVRDMTNFRDLYTDKNRQMIDVMDPQRTWYQLPTDVVYYQQDQNPASSTRAYPMMEMWGIPTGPLVYQLYGIRRGLDLSAPNDTLPPAVGEDCVVAGARVMAYEWAEANKDMSPRSSGPDFKFLMGAAKAEYDRLLKLYRMADRETVNNWFSVRRTTLYPKLWAYYNAASGTANPGGAFG